MGKAAEAAETEGADQRIGIPALGDLLAEETGAWQEPPVGPLEGREGLSEAPHSRPPA